MKAKTYLALLGTFGVLTAIAQAAPSQTSTSQPLGHMARVDTIYGDEVISSDKQKLGKLNNLLIDLETGRILYGVIGTPKGRVAVVPQIFNISQPVGKELHLKVPKAKIDDAPRFTPQTDSRAEWSKAALVSGVYTHFGERAWWQGSGPANEGTFHNVHKTRDVIGMNVEDPSGQLLGKVENVVVNLPVGRIAYVILDPDAKLKLGNNLYVLPPQAFTLGNDQKKLVSGLDRATLTSGPHFAPEKWPNLSDRAFASQVYQHYGKQPWFQTASK